MMTSLFHRSKRPLAAAFAGAITTLSFAPYSWWPVAILSPVLLLLLLTGRTAKQALFIGLFWGLGQFATGLSWVHVSIDNFGGMPKPASLFLMALLISYLSLYPALWAWSLNRFFPQTNRTRYFLAAPALWLVFDWLRGWVMTGFPWLWLGYSQIDSPLSNFAPIGGVELITYIVIVIATSSSYAVIRRKPFVLLVPITLFATGYGLSIAQWVTPQSDKTTEITLIQGNIDQAIKWHPSQRWPTIMKYTDLSRENWDSDIIIWPEAAIPAFEFEIASYLRNIDYSAKKHQTAIITGVVNQDQDKRFYNSILTLETMEGVNTSSI